MINTELLKAGILVESITTASQDFESYFIERMGGSRNAETVKR